MQFAVADAGRGPGTTCCFKRNQDLHVIFCCGCRRESGLRAAPKEIKIWHVIFCRGCREEPGTTCCFKRNQDLARNFLPRMPGGARDHVLFQRNQDLARNFLPRMPGGRPGLRAVSKEIRIWHVIFCRGCRAGDRDYVLFQEIRIWHVIFCRGCLRVSGITFRKKSGLGTYTPPDAYGCLELRAVPRET